MVLGIIGILLCLVAIGYLIYLMVRRLTRETVLETRAPEKLGEGVPCFFSGHDILDRRIYDEKGELQERRPDITCDECNKYYYKEDGQCVQYKYDEMFPGVCLTKLGFSEPCPFQKSSSNDI